MLWRLWYLVHYLVQYKIYFVFCFLEFQRPEASFTCQSRQWTSCSEWARWWTPWWWAWWSPSAGWRPHCRSPPPPSGSGCGAPAAATPRRGRTSFLLQVTTNSFSAQSPAPPHLLQHHFAGLLNFCVRSLKFNLQGGPSPDQRLPIVDH